MTSSTLYAAAPELRKRWLRVSIRGLLAAILLFGLFLGWFAHLRRQVERQESFVADLMRDGIRVNHRRPTLLCFALMKILSTDSLKVESRFSGWVSRGWFYRPEGFNAGRLPEDRVPATVKRLARLGNVCEVTYTDPSLEGLKLFYIGANPKDNLGPHGGTCVIRRYSAE